MLRLFADGDTRTVQEDGEDEEVAVSRISSVEFADISDLLKGQHLPISFRGSVIKYCYGFSIELYLEWILSGGRTAIPHRP